MRALLIAAAVLVGLTGCGQENGTAAAPEQTVESRESAVTVVPPVPPSAVPVPPSTKPQDPPGGPGTTPDPPVTISPTGPVVPAGVTQVPSAQVDASAVPEYHDHRGLVWVYDDGYSLQMFASASSGCGDAQARITSESASEVRIEMRSLPQPQGGPADAPACTTVITPRPVTVALDAPLGERQIYLAAGR
jgi:hypothetical protein